MTARERSEGRKGVADRGRTMRRRKASPTFAIAGAALLVVAGGIVLVVLREEPAPPRPVRRTERPQTPERRESREVRKPVAAPEPEAVPPSAEVAPAAPARPEPEPEVAAAAREVEVRRPTMIGEDVAARLKSFPIAVWLQDPRRAPQYKAAGINLYVGLWKGPTEAQLAALTAADMPVVCHQNEVGLSSANSSIIVAWMHGDEPDNAQRKKSGGGYGPPIAPAKIVEDFHRVRQRDPTRPVLLNLGQGVAWDGWHGRGVRTNHPEDYSEYVRGCDIVSFDIYPVAHSHKAVQGNLWYVARGVERLRTWTAGEKVVWNCIECTRIQSSRKASPEQVRAEVWMAIIHGSTGLVYFVHEWKPRFNEHALLDDPEMLRAVTAINGQIRELSPVLRGPSVAEGASVRSSDPGVPIAVMTKEHDGATYVFSVAMRDGKTAARFAVPGVGAAGEAEVIGEDRTLAVRGGAFEDSFGPYQVHLYRIGK